MHITHTALSVDTRVGQRDGRAVRFAFNVVIGIQRVWQNRRQGGALDFTAGRSSRSFLQSDQEWSRQRWRLAAAGGGGRLRFVGLPQSLEEERQQVRDSREFLLNPRL